MYAMRMQASYLHKLLLERLVLPVQPLYCHHLQWGRRCSAAAGSGVCGPCGGMEGVQHTLIAHAGAPAGCDRMQPFPAAVEEHQQASQPGCAVQSLQESVTHAHPLSTAPTHLHPALDGLDYLPIAALPQYHL